MSESENKRPRRVRYRGTHPRKFGEKYKETAAERYPETVQKVIESGKTPAGTHRPICVREILEVLEPRAGQTVVDATLGYGGHAKEILARIIPGGVLIGLDIDPIELPKTAERLGAGDVPADSLALRQSNFAGLRGALTSMGIEAVDGILADLGVSSMQLDNPERGFSFKFDGPLDLRMNPGRGRPGSALLNSVSESRLVLIFMENADEPYAEVIARRIVERRAAVPIETTQALARIVREAAATAGGVRERNPDDSVRRVFQALRIEVNDEFSALETFLRQLPDCLKPGGRAAILTFHSGEDRRVKKAFQAGLREGIYADAARDVIRPGADEIRANPRAASAKLRWAVRA